MGGGGGGGTMVTRSVTKLSPITNVTNKIDTKPLGEILAKSNEQNAKIQQATQTLEVLNDIENRKLEAIKLNQFDTYFKQSKNIVVISVIAAGLIYVSKKGKK